MDRLAELSRLGDRLESDRRRVRELDKAERLDLEQGMEPPDEQSRRRLSAALADAQSLGDVSQRLADLDRAARELSDQLALALSDLGVESAEALVQARPLLDAEIDLARSRLVEVDQALARLGDEAGRLQIDLEQQELRERELAATGEVVTFDTLSAARLRRDEDWSRVRRVYVERSVPEGQLESAFDPQRPLPEAFEAALDETDRQADLLRADAARAATFEECVKRIERMRWRQRAIADERSALGERRRVLLADWSDRVREAGLPSLDPEALREWQTARAGALDLSGRLARLRAERERLEDRLTQAVQGLSEALRALGEPVGDPVLERLIEQATHRERRATALVAMQEERARARNARRVERDSLAAQIESLETRLEELHASVNAWHKRLFLEPGSTPTAAKTRLDELDELARRVQELDRVRLRQVQQRALVEDFEQRALDLARLLEESAPQLAEDFAQRMQRRLIAAREQEQERRVLIRDETRAQAVKHDAEVELAAQTERLAELCAIAGVETVASLQEREELAERKRRAKARFVAQREQLLQASSRPEKALRERLADQDSVAIDAERERCRAEIARLEEEQAAARREEEQTRRALEAVDTSDAAAKAREAMESAAARYRAALIPWARLRLAHALLRESLKRFRERAQAPMVEAASRYFALISGGRYPRLEADEEGDRPVLRAQREDGVHIGVEAMSEGTADQLYLALRLAALELRRESHPRMPLVLDDVLITSDDERVSNILRALAKFAEGGQVLLFTHHRHLIELARSTLDQGTFAVHEL
jgi:uncharacterized protein YhaN